MKAIQKTFSYRLKSNKTQAQLFTQQAGACRFVYNWGRTLAKEAFDSKTKIPTYVDLAKKLTQLKREPDTQWLKLVHSQSLQQALKDLDRSMQTFFKDLKQKKKAYFPGYRKRNLNDSFSYPQNVQCADDLFFLPKIGWVSYRNSRSIEGSIKQATIKREGKHWNIHVVCEIPHNVSPVPIDPEKAVGIDLGLNHYAYISNGKVIENPRYLKADLNQLRRLHRNLSRKKRGSLNRQKAARRVATKHRSIKNKRKDFLHKVTTALIKSHDVFAVETLSISGMIRNRRLARSIADAGWAMFITFLNYKAGWTGKHLVKIGRFFPSSKQCSGCNEIQDMPLCVRRFACKSCGIDLDRDLNASINIRAAGLAVLACGGNGVGFPDEARISGLKAG